MFLYSVRWLELSYFTYFFNYGIFLPFWSVWLKGIGSNPEMIGLLLEIGLVSRFLGSLLITPCVSSSASLIKALRILSILTLAFVLSFWISHQFTWLVIVMIGFNLFFSPLVPLTDALANTWQKQMTINYGRVRLWGSIAFIIGSALAGKLVSLFDYQVILTLLSFGVTFMLFSMLIQPSIMPKEQNKYHQRMKTNWPKWQLLVTKNWYFLACVFLLQGAHAAYYGFSAIYWQEEGHTASVVGYLWSLSVIAEVIVFALSKKLFRHFSARDLFLLSSACSLLRWGIMGWTSSIPWLIIAQLLHCGTFTVCHLAAMRYINMQRNSEIIRLQAVYSAIAMGGSTAVMTVFVGFLYQKLGSSVFWVMMTFVIPVIVLRPK